jgi:hypothetical protein
MEKSHEIHGFINLFFPTQVLFVFDYIVLAHVRSAVTRNLKSFSGRHDRQSSMPRVEAVGETTRKTTIDQCGDEAHGRLSYHARKGC